MGGIVSDLLNLKIPEEDDKPTGCLGYYEEMSGDYDCEYDTILTCEECKYGCGRKDPDAKCNRV